MKGLPLENIKHLQLEKGFRNWLDLTGYAATSVYGMPNYIREFLHYLETESKPIETLEPQDINTYFFHLKHRRKQRRTGALSNNYLHKHLQAIKKFSHYLKETGQGNFETDIILPEQKGKTPEILTKEEIKQLYAACGSSPIGLRDRAMLSVFYGCGLRRNEGVSLDIQDFLSDKNLLYVRKGKNYKERYVPLTPETKQDLQEYLDYGRSSQIKDTMFYTERSRSEEAFFLSERGTRITGQSLHLRLKQLLSKAEITKDAGLHTLRHSIATHLLQSGMKLQNIARLLGHKSLESTQLYTHIINEL
jgi:integrase/recombinase XerD